MKTYFAINRKNKTVVALPGFEYWELVQNAFRFGILMPDGHNATGIGRCKSLDDLVKRASHSGFTLLKHEIVLLPQPVPSFTNRACIDCGEWSASGGPLCEDCQEAKNGNC